ncbi:hypothetical protein NECID01_0888 [Nematocida sp. AWRm77]|nr:hypothetical protein NECID01_0888 [Nematocida sp. AWRm77]
MHGIVEGIEECGRVVLFGALFSQVNLSSESPVWSGVFRNRVVQGHSPFKSGVFAGCIASLSTPEKMLRQAVTGGMFGVGITLVGKLNAWARTRLAK